MNLLPTAKPYLKKDKPLVVHSDISQVGLEKEMKLSVFFGTFASVTPELQFLDFWNEMDVFANKIRDFASKAGRFSSNYKKAKKAVLFYQNAGTCLSTVTNPTYNFVDVTSFNEQLNMGSNILALSEMIESWVQEGLIFFCVV